MTIEPAPYGIRYDHRGICFFEVRKDGSINRINNSRSVIINKENDSLYKAYFNVLSGDCSLFCAYADSNGNISIYQVKDLEAFADSIGIERPTEHIHDIRWSYSQNDPGTGRYALLDIEFLCGCKLSKLNCRIIAKQLYELFGWNVILNSIGSIPSSKTTIKVERNSI